MTGHSKYPIITGHEFAGEIVEVGKNVKKLKVGDLVSVESMHWCGECDACRRGMFNQCKELEERDLHMMADLLSMQPYMQNTAIN